MASSQALPVRTAPSASNSDAVPAVRSGAFLIHHRLKTSSAEHKMDIALTLDACSGSVDLELVRGLIRLNVPATVFVTKRWLLVNQEAIAVMSEHPKLFQFENHGAMHVPPVIGLSVYGIRGVPDESALRSEVSGGTEAMVQILKKPARWYRGATAHYDSRSLAIVEEMGYRIAGFSLNGDDGATLAAASVENRMMNAKAGDIVLVHMNHPKSGTGRGLIQALPKLQKKGFRFVRLSDAEGVERY